MTTMTTITNDEFDAATALVSLRTRKPKQGHLAKVSLYEFVNDWVRPEISFKIFSYLGDPHKEGIKKAQKYRRVYHKKRYWWLTYIPQDSRHPGRLPYNKTPLYKHIGSRFQGLNTDHYPEWWGRGGQQGRWEGLLGCVSSGVMESHKMTIHELKYCNNLLRELWAFNIRYDGRWHVGTFSRYGRYKIKNGDFSNHLKINNVKGRSTMCKGKPHSQRNTRHDTITALIKL